VHFAELTAIEQRVLGCLIEKRWTTPDQYPLSLNALRLACNQSTNRDPVTDYDESAVRNAAQRLSHYGLARLASGAGSRATKYRHLAEEGLGLNREQLAVLCVMLLRGPQTPGELKARGDRMAHLATLEDVDRVLGELGDRGYAARLDRRPGQKEDRFRQLLGGGADDDPAPAGGYDEPVTRRGYDEPVTRDGYDQPAARDGYDQPAARDGYDQPAARDGYDQPAVQDLRPPVDGPGPGPGPADHADLEARVAALEADVAELRSQLSDLLD
jgi:uncharacterized protein YceH (UPF0502 family)